MKKRKIVSVSLFPIASWLLIGCLGQPDEWAESDRAEQSPTGDPASEEIASFASAASGTGKWVFINERPCDDLNCTERGCYCNGPFCPGRPVDGQPCSFRGECIVRRGGGPLPPPPDDLGNRGPAKVFFCEYQ